MVPLSSSAASLSFMQEYSVCSSTFTFTTSLLWVLNLHCVKKVALLTWLSLRTKVTLWKQGSVLTKQLKCKRNILKKFQLNFYHHSSLSPVCKHPLSPSPFESCFLILTSSGYTSTTPQPSTMMGQWDLRCFSVPHPQLLHSCWHSCASSFWSCFAYWVEDQIILVLNFRKLEHCLIEWLKNLFKSCHLW